ncbi:MAG: helix-turn-helix domain-containing protein [Clostridiales bacterium]|nr:helix-turn-helix domain-containing protein [Clostridiales bacterium]
MSINNNPKSSGDNMENFDCYLFGYAAGYLTGELEESGTSVPNSSYWSKQPFSYQAFIVQETVSKHLLTPELQKCVAHALSGIEVKEPETFEDGSEKILPVAQQGHWIKGYFAGIEKAPLAPLENLPVRRKKAGYSQASLAKALNVGQSQVARWEQGKEKLPAKHYWNLVKLLEGFEDEI